MNKTMQILHIKLP